MRTTMTLAALCIAASMVEAQTGTIVFEGARVIVGDDSVIEDAVLIVEDGKIQDVGPRGSVSPPGGATHVSLEGKTVMPLLVDLHGHVGFLKEGVFAAEHYGAENIVEQLRILEYFGVGAFLSLGTDLGPDAWRVRAEQRAGNIGGARLLVAGRGFVAPGGGPPVSPLEHVPYEVDRPELARLLVRDNVDRGVDMIKLWVDDRNGTRPKLPPEIYRAVIDEAHKNGTRVIAHVYDLADAKELLRAGVDGFAHMVRDREIDDEFLRLARERNIFQASTLAVQATPVTSGWLRDPAFREATPAHVIQRLEAGVRASAERSAAGGSLVPPVEQFKTLMRKNVAKLKSAGIRIALGGDTGIPMRFLGYNEHLELQALVDMGLTPLEAITAGTSVAANILGLEDLGSLTPGKSADFIVLDANPLVNIENTTRIASVYRQGRPIERAWLAKAGKEQATSTPPRTPWGHPDLQGLWDYRTITPLERPSEFAGKRVLTDEEAADFGARENRRLNRDLIDPKKGGVFYPPESKGGVVPYNEFWYDRGATLVEDKRTSLIVDPPDGKVPPLTAEAQKRSAARREYRRDHPADSWEDRSLVDRCIVGLNAGPPIVPGPYNNNVQLFQTPDYVVILTEMIHNARIVPLDGRPHGTIRQWAGDARGHWEDDTLVVETTNLSEKSGVRGSSLNLHLVERFTRVSSDTIRYEFTVDDPVTWTRPWTVVVPMTKTQGPMFEYACHEGNYAMEGILSGARAAERAAATAATPGSR